MYSDYRNVLIPVPAINSYRCRSGLLRCSDACSDRWWSEREFHDSVSSEVSLKSSGTGSSTRYLSFICF